MSKSLLLVKYIQCYYDDKYLGRKGNMVYIFGDNEKDITYRWSTKSRYPFREGKIYSFSCVEDETYQGREINIKNVREISQLVGANGNRSWEKVYKLEPIH